MSGKVVVTGPLPRLKSSMRKEEVCGVRATWAWARMPSYLSSAMAGWAGLVWMISGAVGGGRSRRGGGGGWLVRGGGGRARGGWGGGGRGWGAGKEGGAGRSGRGRDWR